MRSGPSHGTDFRFRPPTPALRELRVWRERETLAAELGTEPAPAGKDAPTWMAEARAAGLSRLVVAGRTAPRVEIVSALNDEVCTWAAAHPELLAAPNVSLAMTSTPACYEPLLERPEVVAISVEPGNEAVPTTAGDPRYAPLLDACAATGTCVIITQSRRIGPAKSWDPRPVGDVARRHPKVRILVGHGAWPHMAAAFALVEELPNVWISPDVYWHSQETSRAWSGSTRERILTRLVFGSGYPLDRPRAAVARWVGALGADAVRDVLCRNADELLGHRGRSKKGSTDDDQPGR